MASLALVHHAASTASESSLMELMHKIVVISPAYTGKDGDFIPPPTWGTTDRATVQRVKDLMVESIVWDTKVTTTPVVHVGMHFYSIPTFSQDSYKWCKRLCASKDDKNPKPLLAPSWDRNERLRFTLRLPQLARRILSEFGTMYAQLQAAVDALPIAAVTGPSPTQVCAEEDEFGPCLLERRPHRPHRPQC